MKTGRPKNRDLEALKELNELSKLFLKSRGVDYE